MRKIDIFDSTLRDGAQAHGISFSVQDKLNIAKALDELGVDYIEAGNPGSNPKDMEFFQLLAEKPLKHSKLAAFGSTRRKNIKVEEDANVQSLLKAGTPCVTIFGKSWDIHVTDIIRTDLDENLAMIRDTVRFFKDKGKEVVYDAEHFFDGYKNNPEYAMKTIQAAIESGADVICLCDTNGASLPDFIYKTTRLVCDTFNVKVGIHTHNDAGMAVANSIMAIEAGANHVQGTMVGFGERCGNANLSTIIGNIHTKMEYIAIPRENLVLLTETSRKIAEIANIILDANMPYVGMNAFTHKAGMHVDGVMKNSRSFEHISPEIVGNSRRFLMSEVGGRSVIIDKVRKFMPDITKDSKEAAMIVEKVKELEYNGFQYEGADCSFELMVMKLLGRHRKMFTLDKMKIFSEQDSDSGHGKASAMVKVSVDDKHEMAAAEGDGPVNALDKALKKALCIFYPEIADIKLTDYKVRVLDSASATAANVRVLIESTDGHDFWTSVGVSRDIIHASCMALTDSIEYKLMKSRKVYDESAEDTDKVNVMKASG